MVRSWRRFTTSGSGSGLPEGAANGRPLSPEVPAAAGASGLSPLFSEAPRTPLPSVPWRFRTRCRWRRLHRKAWSSRSSSPTPGQPAALAGEEDRQLPDDSRVFRLPWARNPASGRLLRHEAEGGRGSIRHLSPPGGRAALRECTTPPVFRGTRCSRSRATTLRRHIRRSAFVVHARSPESLRRCSSRGCQDVVAAGGTDRGTGCGGCCLPALASRPPRGVLAGEILSGRSVATMGSRI